MLARSSGLPTPGFRQTKGRFAHKPSGSPRPPHRQAAKVPLSSTNRDCKHRHGRWSSQAYLLRSNSTTIYAVRAHRHRTKTPSVAMAVGQPLRRLAVPSARSTEAKADEFTPEGLDKPQPNKRRGRPHPERGSGQKRERLRLPIALRKHVLDSPSHELEAYPQSHSSYE